MKNNRNDARTINETRTIDMPVDPNEAPKGTIAVEHPGPTCPGEICIFYGKKQCADQTCYGDDRKDKTGCYFIEKPQPTETKTMEDEYEYLTLGNFQTYHTALDWILAGEAYHEIITNVYSHDFGNGKTTHREASSWVQSGLWCFTAGIKAFRRKKPKTEVLLTDPEEIMRGIRAGVVECIHWNGGCLPATVPDSQFIATKLGLGLKYRLKHGYKLPPKKTKKLVPRTAEEFWPLIGKWWCRREENKTYRFLILNSNGIPDQENWEIAPLGTEEWQPMCKEIEVEE